MNNKVSVIMGIYNCDKYLSQSIESILNQTYDNIELIMCDDGSIDNTFKIAEDYRKKYPEKIKVIKNEKNRGLNYTLNECLKIATGQYIARQDGDDISKTDRIEKQVKFLDNHPEYAVIGCDAEFFDEKGVFGRTNEIEKPEKKDFYNHAPFCHPATMTRKDVYDQVEGYTVDDKLLRVEDYHLWYKIYSKGYKGYNLKEILYEYRDNRESFKRRTLKSSLNYTRLKWKVFRDFKISITKYPYIIKPIIMSLLPRKIYGIMHKNRLKNKN